MEFRQEGIHSKLSTSKSQLSTPSTFNSIPIHKTRIQEFIDAMFYPNSDGYDEDSHRNIEFSCYLANIYVRSGTS